MTIKARQHYHAQTAQELSFVRGDEFTILEVKGDWLLVSPVNEPSKKGFIPSSLVGDESERLERLSIASSIKSDYNDDEWDSDEYMDHGPSRIKRRLSKLYPRKRKTMDPLQPEQVTEIALEQSQGCKASLLAAFFNEGAGKPSQTVTPNYNMTYTAFRDLHFDYKKKTLNRFKTSICMSFGVVEARNMPLFESNPDFQFMGYQLRVSLFDKYNALSNVHTLGAKFIKDKNLFKFSEKESAMFPTDDDNTCLLRTDIKDPNLCLLFELNALVSNAAIVGNDLAEVCCAWGTLPLYAGEGKPVGSGGHQVILFQGNAMDKNPIPLPPFEKKGRFGTSIENPTLSVKLWELSSHNLKEFGQLPETIITRFDAGNVLVLYRQIFASVVYDQNWDGSLDNLNEPLLTLVPLLCDKPLLLRQMCLEFSAKMKILKRKEKRSLAKKRVLLSEIAIQLWPLLNSEPHAIHSANPVELEKFYDSTFQKFKLVSLFWTKKDKETSIVPFNIQELCI